MRFTAMLAIAMVAGTAAKAGQRKGESLTIYVRNSANTPQESIFRAEKMASSMFASIGVRIDWRAGEPSPTADQPLAIEITTGTPKSIKPGALAYARPYEGVHIIILEDRIDGSVAPVELLAHVMVHEITHILEGIDRHSANGIMKARWTAEDFMAMKIHALRFADEDLDLIQQGLAARRTSLAAVRGTVPALDAPQTSNR